MQPLSALDATFLEVEDAVSHMHIASIALFEGPPPEAQELHEMVLAKLPLVPRYRQVVRFVPFSAGRPVWVDDPYFNLEYHLRHSALPTPGSEEQLHMMIGRVMSQQLDRGKPLWEMWVVEGAGASRRAGCVGADIEDPSLHGRWRRRRGPAEHHARPCTRHTTLLAATLDGVPYPRARRSCSRAPSPRSPCGRSRPYGPCARRVRSPSAAATPLEV